MYIAVRYYKSSVLHHGLRGKHYEMLVLPSSKAVCIFGTHVYHLRCFPVVWLQVTLQTGVTERTARNLNWAGHLKHGTFAC